MAIPSAVDKMIRDFAKRKGTAFPNIARSTVEKGLRKRVENPLTLSQGDSSLCGPAAFIFCLAKKKPAVYTKYVIDLYEKGEATIGQLLVRPSVSCKSFRGGSNQIADVDWVALASLRDSENAPSGPDPADPEDDQKKPWSKYYYPDQQIGGITLPWEVTKWFSCAGFSVVRNKTNHVSDKSLYSLLEAQKAYSAGASVCLFVCATILSGLPGQTLFPDHWVVLDSIIKIGGRPSYMLIKKGEKAIAKEKALLSQKLDFRVFTWNSSKSTYPVDKNKLNLTVGEFLNYYYGYIAVL